MSTVTNTFFNRLPGVWENKIHNEWQDSWGWNFIAQPQLNNPGISDFAFRSDQMRETITFKEIGIPRNVGISGKAGFWHAMSYEISITTPQGIGIHHEMGHFLLEVVDDVTGDTAENLRGDIIRQATIPRANAMMTTGQLKPGSVQSSINQHVEAFYNAHPESFNPSMQTTIDTDFNTENAAIQGAGGPDMTQPLQWLQNFPGGTVEDIDWVFELLNDTTPSQMASGHRVARPVDIGNLLSEFWIGKRKLESGELVEFLQYAQRVDLKFSHIDWPHVALNTLIKQ